MKNAQLYEQKEALFPRAFSSGFRRLVLGGVLFLLSQQVFAESDEVAGWLNRAAVAAHQLNYKGVVSHSLSQNARNERSEYSKIEHYARENKEYLRMETLNGLLRETIRINDVVHYYLPDLKTVRVMPNALSHTPPGVMRHNIQNNAKELLKSYTFAKAEVERVAGRTAQVVVFTPKDNFRYEQRFWIDRETGLFLAGRTVDLLMQREVERFAFADIEINIPQPESLIIAWPELPTDWTVEQTGFEGKKNVASGWLASALPPGFSKIAEETRRFTGRSEATTVLVYSDGLVAVSVFIERVQEGTITPMAGGVSPGFLAAHTRREGGYLITALGQVPNDTLRLIAQGLARK
ncbi:MAG: MucB/RseB C-terminal domain-containing protein [Burkholderiales bacterium]|jgi:sigma-E factor negative regulatory protein RseB|nr:MucB/RseB C-terminal domain-containing protein [Burkholderiales bacterium]